LQGFALNLQGFAPQVARLCAELARFCATFLMFATALATLQKPGKNIPKTVWQLWEVIQFVNLFNN
jgi:hypothetical protein